MIDRDAQLVLAACLLAIFPVTSNAAKPTWAGKGDFRVITRIASDQQARPGDEQPAEVTIDFVKLLNEVGIDRLPDMTSVQVIRHDANTGKPIKQNKFAYAMGEFDLPWRWYDASIAYEFPEVERAVSYTDGKLEFKTRPRFGYYYHCIGDWKAGKLVFPHRRGGVEAATYAVYFNLLPAGVQPATVPPRGFIGDGLQRCTPEGNSTTGLIHSRVETVDWNGDGLFDLLVGCARGGIVFYPNHGQPGKPRFEFSKLVHTSDGRPLNVGWSAAPRAVDWDGDGVLDLVVGAEWNRILLYRNRGTAAKPELEYTGPLHTDDGKLLTLPITPVAESPDVFKRDYYPVLDMVDWDADGDLDMLAGGYITGRIYLYENVAGPLTEPSLKLAGPLETDGQPIDVGWCAAPTVADFDCDGDLDLISGCMPVTAGGGDAASSKKFLHYFRNDGSRAVPKLHEIPMPQEGVFPNTALGTPRAVDFNGDGLLDLIASAYQKIFLFANIGTKTEPRFAAHSEHLPSRWGSASLAAVQFIDWDGDGLLDGANGPRIYRNKGVGSPGLFESPISLLKPGQRIDHLSGIGDDWKFQRLFDLDSDGLIDLMDADHGGHIWWHRNRGKQGTADFDTAGIRLELTSGEPVQVGLNREGFDKLQGARATYTVGDFNGDKLQDLVVADTYGIIRYFQQAKQAQLSPARFEKPVQLGKLPIRAVPFAADWNGDDLLDVVSGSSADNVIVFINEGNPADKSPFAAAQPIKLSGAPYGAGAPLVITDYNGDGDPDILLHTAYGYTCWFERSFIERGYAGGEVLRLERR